MFEWLKENFNFLISFLTPIIIGLIFFLDFIIPFVEKDDTPKKVKPRKKRKGSIDAKFKIINKEDKKNV